MLDDRGTPGPADPPSALVNSGGRYGLAAAVLRRHANNTKGAQAFRTVLGIKVPFDALKTLHRIVEDASARPLAGANASEGIFRATLATRLRSRSGLAARPGSKVTGGHVCPGHHYNGKAGVVLSLVFPRPQPQGVETKCTRCLWNLARASERYRP